jgi:hypothetical protein
MKTRYGFTSKTQGNPKAKSFVLVHLREGPFKAFIPLLKVDSKQI